MSELEERVRAALSDPGELERLTKMAQRIMGGTTAAEPETRDGSGESERPDAVGAALGRVMGSLRTKNEPPLLAAVGPYLDEGRRRRLERALRLASTARLAGTALEKLGGLDGL